MVPDKFHLTPSWRVVDVQGFLNFLMGTDLQGREFILTSLDIYLGPVYLCQLHRITGIFSCQPPKAPQAAVASGK